MHVRRPAVRVLSRSAFVLASCVAAFGCGKKPPEGASNPPGEGPTVAAADPSSSKPDEADPATADPGSAQPKTCEAAVADTPVPLFGERIIIRPPVNVELVEDNPTTARTMSTAGYVSACEATVDEMWLLVFERDKAKKLAAFTDEFINVYLNKAGYTNGERAGNELESDTSIHAIVEYPPGDGKPAQSVYVAATEKEAQVYVAVYVTRPNELEALKPSFKKSAETLFVVPD